MALVSCEVNYDVRYRVRGSSSSIGQETIASINFGRRLDDISKASITHILTDNSCCSDLGRIEPWADTIEIRGDGDLKWTGVVTSVEYSRNTVVVEAHDELIFSRYRVLTENYEKTQDSSLHFVDLWNNAMAWNPRPVNLIASNTGVVEARKYQIERQNRISWFILKELLESSVDVTVLGQNIYIGTLNLGKPLTLNASDFAGEITVRKAGELYAGQAIVEGARAVRGSYPVGRVAGEGIYPLVQDTQYDEALQTNEAAAAAAKSRYDYSAGIVPRIVRAGDALQLRQGAVSLDQLIPSTIITLDVTDELCIGEKQQYRLGSVDVEVAGGIETITIALQPIGTIAQLEGITADDDRGAATE